MFNKISSLHEHMMHLKGKIFLFLICFVKAPKKTLKNDITRTISKNKLPSREKLIHQCIGT